MITQTWWQPPRGYTGTRRDAEALAIERQKMAAENLLLPTWNELTPHEREMSVLDAANYLTALRRCRSRTDGDLRNRYFEALMRQRDFPGPPGSDHAGVVRAVVGDVRAVMAVRDDEVARLQNLVADYEQQLADLEAQRNQRKD